jgi:hypothetical protein
MATVETIIAKLQESSEWEDGESLAAIRSRLTAGQLQGPGTLVLRISERGPLPSLLCGRVVQSGTALFEVTRGRLGVCKIHTPTRTISTGGMYSTYSQEMERRSKHCRKMISSEH